MRARTKRRRSRMLVRTRPLRSATAAARPPRTRANSSRTRGGKGAGHPAPFFLRALLLLRRQRLDEAIARPKFADDRQFHRPSLGECVVVVLRLNLVRLRKAAVIVQTVQPVLGHLLKPPEPSRYDSFGGRIK